MSNTLILILAASFALYLTIPVSPSTFTNCVSVAIGSVLTAIYNGDGALQYYIL